MAGDGCAGSSPFLVVCDGDEGPIVAFAVAVWLAPVSFGDEVCNYFRIALRDEVGLRGVAVFCFVEEHEFREEGLSDMYCARLKHCRVSVWVLNWGIHR